MKQIPEKTHARILTIIAALAVISGCTTPDRNIEAWSNQSMCVIPSHWRPCNQDFNPQPEPYDFNGEKTGRIFSL